MAAQDDRLDVLEDRVTALEHTTWGVKGDNGMAVALRELRDELRAAKADELRRSRAAVTAAVSSVVALIGVIVTLVVVLTTAGP